MNLLLLLSLPFLLAAQQAPFVVGTVPSAGTINFPIDTALQVAFSVPMDRLSVQGAFSLTPICCSMNFVWNGDSTAVLITRHAALWYDTGYTMTVNNTARSVQNVRMTSTFSLLFRTIYPPPQIVAIHPNNGATNVLPTFEGRVQFNQPMERITTERAVALHSAPYTRTWNADFTVLTLSAYLEMGRNYSLVVEPNIARSQYGQYLANGVRSEFVTIAGPRLVNTVPCFWCSYPPSLNAIELWFNLAMRSVDVVLHTQYQEVFHTYLNYTDNQTYFSFTPLVRLRPIRLYTAVVRGWSVANGLEFVGNFSFYTQAILYGPSVTSVSPAPGSELAEPPIVINFDSPMQAWSVEQAFSLNPYVASGTWRWSASRDSVTIPYTALNATNYTAVVTRAAYDEAGQQLQTEFLWHFRTARVPRVDDTFPYNGMDEVDLFQPIYLYFGETFHRDSLVVRTSPTMSFNLVVNSTRVVAYPQGSYREQTNYVVQVDACAQMCMPTYTFYFSTTAAPLVEATIPPHGSTGVNPSAPLRVLFNVPMEVTSTINAFALSPNNTSIRMQLSSDGVLLSISPNTRFTTNTRYYMTMSTNARSRSGLFLRAPMNVTFTTGVSATLTTQEAVLWYDEACRLGKRRSAATEDCEMATLYRELLKEEGGQRSDNPMTLSA